jgi:hypothetical protein
VRAHASSKRVRCCAAALFRLHGTGRRACAGTRTAHSDFPVGASVGDRRRAWQGRRHRAAGGGPSVQGCAGTPCVRCGY